MITVFGSLNVDLLFNLDRLPAPGETVLTREIIQLPGGKGANQATAAAKAGAPTRFVGCVGTDGLGAPVLASLEAAGCDVSGVRTVPGATGTAVVMVERSGENQIVVGSGANMAVEAGMLAGAALGPGDTLVCQMEIPLEATVAGLAAARRAGARTVLNLAPAPPHGAARRRIARPPPAGAPSRAAPPPPPPRSGVGPARPPGPPCGSSGRRAARRSRPRARPPAAAPPPPSDISPSGSCPALPFQIDCPID